MAAEPVMADPTTKASSATDATAASKAAKKTAPKPAVKTDSAPKPKPGNSADKTGPGVPPKATKTIRTPKTPKTQPETTKTFKPKPPKPNPDAKPPAKQASKKNEAPPKVTPQVAAARVRKSRAKASKGKQSTPSPTATRPTMSDGKVERQIWQPSDGNGDPSPELVEKFRTKKTGHPTWKLYTGRNVPKQPSDTNPPHFVYLDDKAAWDIFRSKHWTADEKHRYWAFDFTPNGQITFTRPNRGRPAYENDGKTFTSLRRRKDKCYWFHGCHPEPTKDGSSAAAPVAAEETEAAPAGQVSVAEPPLVAEHTLVPEQRLVPDKAPLFEQPSASVTEDREIVRAPEQEQKSAPAEEIHTEPSPKTTPYIGPATTKLDYGSESAAELTDLTPHPAPQGTVRSPISPPSTPQGPRQLPSPPARPTTLDRPPKQQQQLLSGGSKIRQSSATTSVSPTPSAQTGKRPSSSDSVAGPAPKRQRKAIEPYEIPLDVRLRDTELVELRKRLRVCTEREDEKDREISRLREQRAYYHHVALQSTEMLKVSERKVEAFRKMALKLYARTIDQQNELAEHHKALLKLMEGAANVTAAAERMATDARRDLDPVSAVHANLDAIMEESGEAMQDAGFQVEFDEFVREAMNTDE